ncbi:MFS transporter [Streptomyces sp. RKND-216]|uniref:MFS transporter n=1 Tax=Streptomyces sp. RKND-216 TaxID=2562581 RepID=UPI00109DE975|nr:MFS transporter [Streptomyces sp. RKND-216]THA26997.1 MFS transporter [Streptomyces sp. RKND-216]
MAAVPDLTTGDGTRGDQAGYGGERFHDVIGTAGAAAAGVFRRLWAGEAMARLGYRTAQFLLPLLAVVELGSSGSQTGLVSAAQFVPVVALSLTAGVFADRLDPRRLVLVCTVVRGAALGMLGLSYAAFGLTLWMLLAVALVVGSATVFYDVGYQSAIPKLLRPQELAAGNSLLQAVNSATQMAGPALAALESRWTAYRDALPVRSA